MNDKVEEGICKLIEGGWVPSGKMIGIEKDADYQVLQGHEVRCVRFTFFGEINRNRITPPAPGLPYGFVHVESTVFPKGTVVALIRKDDFRNAWAAEEFMSRGSVTLRYRERGYPTNELNRLLPMLEFLVSDLNN